MSHVDLDEMRALLRAQTSPKGTSSSAQPRRALAAAPAETAPETRDLFEALDPDLNNPPLFAAAPPPPAKRSSFGKRSTGPTHPTAPLLLTDRTAETRPLRLDALAIARAPDDALAETPFHPDDLRDDALAAAQAPPAAPAAVEPAPEPVLDTRRKRLLHGLAQTLAQEQDQLDAARSDVAAPLILSPLRRRRGERDYKDFGFANDRH